MTNAWISRVSHRDSGGDDGPKTAPRGVPVQAVGHCSLAWNEPTENDSIDQMKGLFIILSPVITVVLRQRRLPSYQLLSVQDGGSSHRLTSTRPLAQMKTLLACCDSAPSFASEVFRLLTTPCQDSNPVITVTGGCRHAVP